MYHLTVTSVRSFMHVTRADHVQTKRNPFSSYIYMHVYMSQQSITGKMATIQSGIMYTCRPIGCFRRSPDFLDPRHTCTKSHVLSGCLHFVWTEPCWKQYILEYEEKRKNQQNQSMHHILYIYISLVNTILCLNS